MKTPLMSSVSRQTTPRQVQGPNLGLTEPHTRVSPFICVHVHEGHEKFSLSTMDPVRLLHPCCHSAALTPPTAKVILSYSSQTSWILLLAWIPSLIYTLFCLPEVPHPFYDLQINSLDCLSARDLTLSPRLSRVAARKRQSFTCFLEMSRLNSLRWSHRKLQQLWEPSPSYLHLSCLILKRMKDNRLDLFWKAPASWYFKDFAMPNSTAPTAILLHPQSPTVCLSLLRNLVTPSLQALH